MTSGFKRVERIEWTALQKHRSGLRSHPSI